MNTDITDISSFDGIRRCILYIILTHYSKQLKNSYIRIKNLTEEVQQLRRKIQPEAMFHRQDMPTGWAMPPSENPDAPHIKENNMTKKEKNNG